MFELLGKLFCCLSGQLGASSANGLFAILLASSIQQEHEFMRTMLAAIRNHTAVAMISKICHHFGQVDCVEFFEIGAALSKLSSCASSDMVRQARATARTFQRATPLALSWYFKFDPWTKWSSLV